ncbi:MAG: hypothetical protein JWP75_1428 [Frondihabitans sp.]|nr:hypothetical protein [Frondihabitans sp.]
MLRHCSAKPVRILRDPGTVAGGGQEPLDVADDELLLELPETGVVVVVVELLLVPELVLLLLVLVLVGVVVAVLLLVLVLVGVVVAVAVGVAVDVEVDVLDPVLESVVDVVVAALLSFHTVKPLTVAIATPARPTAAVTARARRNPLSLIPMFSDS